MGPTDKHTFKTVDRPSTEILFKEQNSKFYGYVFPLVDAEAVKGIIEGLRRKYPTANHACYAWRIGINEVIYKVHDDGEPNNSAGMPIYGQILSFDVTNILVVVVRIFGGTKLGVGGLMSTYKTTAQMALACCEIIEKTAQSKLLVSCKYDELEKVMRIVKHHQLEIISQAVELNCSFVIGVPKNQTNRMVALLEVNFGIKVKIV